MGLSRPGAPISKLHSQLVELQRAFRDNLVTKDEYTETKAQLLRDFVSLPASTAKEQKKTTFLNNVTDGASPFTKLVFSDDFSEQLDLEKWEHEITMGGGGNWEFECESPVPSCSCVRVIASCSSTSRETEWL